MKKKTILNICMVLTIVLVAVCGIMAVGSIKGWWDAKGGSGAEGTGASDLIVSEKTGIAMIERSGVAYEVTTGTVIRSGDQLYTKKAATLTVADAEKNLIIMGENAEIATVGVDGERRFEVLSGEVLVDARGVEQLTIVSGENEIVANGAVLSVSTQPGASMAYVYAGEIKTMQGDSEVTVKSGTVLTMVQGESQNEETKLQAASLSDSQIMRLLECGMDESFCFTEADLKQVQADREAEIQRARQELLAKKEAAKNEKDSETQKSDEKTTSTETNIPVETDADTEQGTTEETTEDVGSDTSQEEDDSLYCTIEIRCDTILDNMENLTSGKEGYVPSSGTILGTTEVAFTEGETVFDVLQRICDSTGIQLEYSWTPLYDSYYIESINHLYEFDCGNESGWMYKVNGWFPNYGCSSYYLEEGDTIVWCYTCNGLGADVGGPVY